MLFKSQYILSSFNQNGFSCLMLFCGYNASEREKLVGKEEYANQFDLDWNGFGNAVVGRL